MEGVAMGPETEESARTRAIEWHIRLRDGDDAAWDAFADWLAEDPRHAEIYDMIEQTDLAIEPLLPAIAFHEAANDGDGPAKPPVHRTRRWVLAGGALAASIAAAVAFIPQWSSSRYEVATRNDERRIVTLDPTTTVTLNGATRMVLDHANPRFASLIEGEALFSVRHDSANPFRLTLGDNILEDAGTVFNVVHQAGTVRVAVAEGKIVYNPGRNAVALNAGQALFDQSGSDRVRVTDTNVENVGSWRQGRLVYSNAPLSQVAADLARALGVRIDVAPIIADRPFTGVIALDGSGADQLDRLRPALDVTFDDGPDGWTMKPVAGAGR